MCGVFFVDFLVNLYQAPRRWRYLATWGWVDLLSSTEITTMLAGIQRRLPPHSPTRQPDSDQG